MTSASAATGVSSIAGETISTRSGPQAAVAQSVQRVLQRQRAA